MFVYTPTNQYKQDPSPEIITICLDVSTFIRLVLYPWVCGSDAMAAGFSHATTPASSMQRHRMHPLQRLRRMGRQKELPCPERRRISKNRRRGPPSCRLRQQKQSQAESGDQILAHHTKTGLPRNFIGNARKHSRIQFQNRNRCGEFGSDG